MFNPNKYIIEETNDKKLRHIASRDSLRVKMEALLLLECEEDIKEFFKITDKQLKEYKRIYFDVEALKEAGEAFVLEYLETQNDPDVLKYYLFGESYAKGKFGMIKNLSDEEKRDLISKAFSTVIIDTLDEKPKAVQNVKNIEKLVKALGNREEDPEESDIDNVLDVLKNKGIEIDD